MSFPSHKILFLLFLFTISFIPTQSSSPKDDTPPSLIIELFRHGSRGPNDPIWDPTWLPSECSSLTAVGARQHYILGKVLREEYIFDAVNGSVNGTSNLQLMLLSAHDDTLLTALTPLGIVTPACLYENFISWKQFRKIPFPQCLYPTFASNMRVEVFNTTIPYVRIYYGGDELWLCNGKASYCTVDQFAQLVKTATNNGNLQTFDTLCNNTGAAVGKMKTVGEVKKSNSSEGEWMKEHLTWIFGAVVVILIGLNVWQTKKCMKVAEEKKKRIRNEANSAEKVLLFEQQA